MNMLEKMEITMCVYVNACLSRFYIKLNYYINVIELIDNEVLKLTHSNTNVYAQRS